MKPKSEIFYCYSPRLKCELLDAGERYIAKGVNPSTNRSYWMFLRNEALGKYLESRKSNSGNI